MTTISLIVVAVLMYISWELAVWIARQYFNRFFIYILINKGHNVSQEILFVFLPCMLGGGLTAVLFGSLVIMLFPSEVTPFFSNLVVFLIGTPFVVGFFLQIMRDTDHFFKRTKEMIESGDLDRIIEESIRKNNEEKNCEKRK